MPRTTIATDNFTRANGTLGANWTDLNPSFPANIASNTAVGTDTANESSEMWAGAGSWTSDQGAASTIFATAFQSSSYRIGSVTRASGSGATRTFYAAYAQMDSGGPNYTTLLVKCVNGTFTTLHSAQAPWSAGDTIDVDAVGTTITAYRNAVAISGFSVTDAAISTGVPGLYLQGQSTVPRMSNWLGFNVTAPPVVPPVLYRPAQVFVVDDLILT